MVCPKCGKTLPDNAKFCGFCGTKLDDAAGGLVPKQEKVAVKPTAAVQTVERAEGSAIVKPHAAGSKKPLLIAAAVVAVLALAALLFVLFGGRGSNNAYVCLSDGRYELISNLSRGELIEIASSRSDYADLWFSPDGKYIYYFTRLDSEWGTGTLCRAEYGKLKADSSKNDKYITIVSTNAKNGSGIKVLDDGTLLYMNSESTLYYFNGETSEQVARRVPAGTFEVDQDGNLAYLVEDEDSLFFSYILYVTNLKQLDQRTRIDDDVENLLQFTDAGQITYTKYGDPDALDSTEIDLYMTTLAEGAEPQRIDENVSIKLHGNERVVYTVQTDVRPLYDFVIDSGTLEEPNLDDYEIPTYSYYYIESEASFANYDALYTSCTVGTNFFRESMGGRYSIEEVATYYDDPDCQAFLDQYRDAETVDGQFIPLTEAVEADLKLLAQTFGAADDWAQFCIGARQTGTDYDWDAYYAALNRDALRADLKDTENYGLPIYSLKVLKDGQASAVMENLVACNGADGILMGLSLDGLLASVNIEEIDYAIDLLIDLRGNGDLYEYCLLYKDEETPVIRLPLDMVRNAMASGAVSDLAIVGGELFMGSDDGVLYKAPIENNVAGNFSVLSDMAYILGDYDGKVYYRESINHRDDGSYADFCVYENGEVTRLLTDVDMRSIWVYRDGTLLAKTYRDDDGAGELILVDAKGKKTTIADGVTGFARVDESTLLYLSDEDLYVYNGKDKERVATEVTHLWCRDEMKPVVYTGYNTH